MPATKTKTTKKSFVMSFFCKVSDKIDTFSQIDPSSKTFVQVIAFLSYVVEVLWIVRFRIWLHLFPYMFIFFSNNFRIETLSQVFDAVLFFHCKGLWFRELGFGWCQLRFMNDGLQSLLIDDGFSFIVWGSFVLVGFASLQFWGLSPLFIVSICSVFFAPNYQNCLMSTSFDFHFYVIFLFAAGIWTWMFFSCEGKK